jgi:uncharacterized protein
MLLIDILPRIAASNITYEYAAYGLALVVGITLGLVGAGGSILTLPILVYVAGIEPKRATTYSLFVVGTSALLGAINYFRKGLLHFQTVILFFVPSFVAVFFTKHSILPLIPEDIYEFDHFILSKDMLIMLIFSSVMFAAALSMIKKKMPTSLAMETMNEDSALNYKAIIMQGILVGTLTGFVGAGGGFLIVPALTMFARLPIRLTIGTSLMIVAINSLSGFAIDYSSHSNLIDWHFLSAFVGMAFVGTYLGTFLSQFVKAELLKTMFGYFVLIMAIYLLFQQFVGAIFL